MYVYIYIYIAHCILTERWLSHGFHEICQFPRGDLAGAALLVEDLRQPGGLVDLGAPCEPNAMTNKKDFMVDQQDIKKLIKYDCMT